jgi:thermitase
MRRYRFTGVVIIAAMLLAVSLYTGTAVLTVSKTSVAAADDDPTVPLGPAITVTRSGVTAQVRAIQSTRTTDGREAVANRIIVGFQPGVASTEWNAVHQQVAQAVAGVNPTPLKPVGDSAQYVDVTGAPSLEAVIQAYQNDSRVRYAEPDYLVHTADTPNDPYVSNQYALQRIQAPGAWSVTHGTASVKIAILDCGVYEAHPDLSGKVVAHKDFTGSTFGTDDQCNHGTLAAGIASAKTNNGAGVAGVGYDTALMNGKVLLEQFDSAGHLSGANGSSTWIASGIRWAADNGAKVINLSLGSVFTPTSGSGATCSQTFQDAVNYATTKSVTVIAAAGNDGTTELFQPASCAGVISVASTDQNDAKSSFSNYGPWVNVAAPGSAILGPINPTLPENNGQSYGSGDGTSFAAPNVAGLAGLLWATRWNTTAATVSARILTTADPIAGQTGVAWQTGRINAAKAVAGPPPAVTSISPTSRPAGSGAFTLTVNGTGFTSGASVLWNGATRPTTFVSSTQLTAAIPATDLATTGSASVSVANPDGSASPTAVTFTISASPPRPSTISPTTGSAKGGTMVTISGTYFQTGARVTFGGTAATVYSVTATTITAQTPAHAAGTADVVVTNPDGQTGTLAKAYAFTAEPVPTGRAEPTTSGGSPAPAPASRPGSNSGGIDIGVGVIIGGGGQTATPAATPAPMPTKHR